MEKTRNEFLGQDVVKLLKSYGIIGSDKRHITKIILDIQPRGTICTIEYKEFIN